MTSLLQGGTNGGLLIYTHNSGAIEKIVINHIISYSRNKKSILLFTALGMTTVRFAVAPKANTAEALLDSLF